MLNPPPLTIPIISKDTISFLLNSIPSLPPFFNWNKISLKKKLTNVSQSLSNKFDDSTSFLGPPSWVCTNRPMMLDRCNPQPTLLINIATTIVILLITNLLFFEVFFFSSIILFPFNHRLLSKIFLKKLSSLNQNILEMGTTQINVLKIKKKRLTLWGVHVQSSNWIS